MLERHTGGNSDGKWAVLRILWEMREVFMTSDWSVLIRLFGRVI
jgi:hypothetical protein